MQYKRYYFLTIVDDKIQKRWAAVMPCMALPQDHLERIGIYVIEVGEIENFCTKIGSHGPKFVNKLLTEISFDDTCLDDLRSFVERVHKGPHAPLND